LCTKHRRNGIASFQEPNFYPILRTQYIPDFFVAERFGLRNTIFWGSKDLALGWRFDGFQEKVRKIAEKKAFGFFNSLEERSSST
jgi:hypothetical protein